MRRFEGWLFAPGDPRRLAAVRLGLCALLAERLARDVYVQLAEQPEALYRPLSFMKLLPSMPPRGIVVAAQVTGIGLALLAALGLFARVTLPAAWLCAVFLGGMTASTGKVVHNDALLLLAMVPLLVARTSDVWSLDALRRRSRASGAVGAPPAATVAHGWPLRTAMMVAAGGYFFSGFAKILFSGPAWFASDNLRFALYAASDGQRDPNGFALLIADRPWLAHAVAFSVLAFELAFPLILAWPALAWVFVPGSFLLHAGIGAAMRLDYSPWAVTVAVLFVDWPTVVERLKRPALLRWQPWTARR